MPVVTLFWGPDPDAARTVDFGLVAETDTPLALTARATQAADFGLVSEQDSAFILNPSNGLSVDLGLVSEADTSFALLSTTQVFADFGLVQETDTALAPAVSLAGQEIPAVVYDGMQGYLLHTGGPSGASDGADLTICIQCTLNSDGSDMVLAFGDGTVPYLLIRNADNTIDFIGGVAGAVFSVSTAAVAASLGLVTIIASATGTDAGLTVTHAGGTITGTNTPGSATNLDLTADLYFGWDGDGVENFLGADVHLIWLDAVYLDAENPDTIEQFVDTDTNTPRDPGADGSNPLDGDHAPLICHKDSAAAHISNSGAGGGADTAGSFTDGTSPGSYAAGFSGSQTVNFGLVTEADAAMTLNASSGLNVDFGLVTETDTAVAMEPDPGGVGAVTRAHVASYASGTNATVYTTTQSIGTAATGRVVAFFVVSRMNSASNGAPTVTVGGNAAAFQDGIVGSAGNLRVRIDLFSIVVDAGTTAEFIITHPAQRLFTAMEVYDIKGADGATASTTAVDGGDIDPSSDPLTATITIPANGVALGGCVQHRGAVTTFTWTNLTSDFDEDSNDGTGWSVASDAFVGGGSTALTVELDSPEARDSAVFAAWGPA